MTARASATERGDIVLGWLLKLIVSLAIVGVVLFEAGSVIVARVNADSAATDVAGEAALSVGRTSDQKAIEDAARAEAVKHDVTLLGVSVSDDRKSVTVTVEKHAKTLLLHRLSWTRSWTIARTTRTVPVVA